MFKLIGFYINENQKTYVDMVLVNCDKINQKESQSAIDQLLQEQSQKRLVVWNKKRELDLRRQKHCIL